jgi:hypothetical protein
MTSKTAAFSDRSPSKLTRVRHVEIWTDYFERSTPHSWKASDSSFLGHFSQHGTEL